MSIPLTTNTTCDIYRAGNTPPTAPDVAGVACHLTPDWRAGQDRRIDNLTWTHVMLVDMSVDIRDGYTGQSGYALQDTVYIPDMNGAPFIVVFIERMQRGTAYEHKRVYLDRGLPTWPTDEL